MLADSGGPAKGEIDPFAQFLAGLEMRHVLAGQRDLGSGLGIAAHARRAEMQREAAEAADFDALAAGQGQAHLFHHVLDRQFHVVERQMALARGQGFYQLGLRHADLWLRLALVLCTAPSKPRSRRALRKEKRHYSDLPNCSLSRAPSLVVPPEADWYSSRACCISSSSLARIDSCSTRPLRSMPVYLASTASPTLKCWVASSTRSLAMSRAAR